jgi:hypothetical protein
MYIFRKIKSFVLCSVCMLLFVASVSAGPVMKVIDSTIFNAGTLLEGKEKLLKHIIIIKNTGDAVLQIKQVRPG